MAYLISSHIKSLGVVVKARRDIKPPHAETSFSAVWLSTLFVTERYILQAYLKTGFLDDPCDYVFVLQDFSIYIRARQRCFYFIFLLLIWLVYNLVRRAAWFGNFMGSKTNKKEILKLSLYVYLNKHVLNSILFQQNSVKINLAI